MYTFYLHVVVFGVFSIHVHSLLYIEIRDRSIPVLLLANKMDIRGSLTSIQVNMTLYMYICICMLCNVLSLHVSTPCIYMEKKQCVSIYTYKKKQYVSIYIHVSKAEGMDMQ